MRRLRTIGYDTVANHRLFARPRSLQHTAHSATRPTSHCVKTAAPATAMAESSTSTLQRMVGDQVCPPFLHHFPTHPSSTCRLPHPTTSLECVSTTNCARWTGSAARAGTFACSLRRQACVLQPGPLSKWLIVRAAKGTTHTVPLLLHRRRADGSCHS